MTGRIRTAVIGVGYFGRYHADKLATLEDSELIAVCDTWKDRREKLAKQYKVPGLADFREVLGREDLGVLAPGKAADLAVFDLRGLAYAGALHDPIAALLFCGVDQRAELVMVDGQVVVREGRLVAVDEREVAAKAGKASQELLKRAGVI